MREKVIIELNSALPKELHGIHDIYIPLDPPYRSEIPVFKPSDRIGSSVVKIDPEKIVGVVMTDKMDEIKPFTEPDETTKHIGANVCSFLIGEMRKGIIPPSFLPIQSGVGNVANAVLYGLADAKEIPPFEMYTEVIQDAVLDLMKKGRCKFGSTCSLTVSTHMEEEFLGNLDFYKDKLCIRPAEISNNPEVVRRLGVITMNTALEADIFGNVNSTHVTGTKMMNGIGGSGDFTRNAYISIFSCPSITKGGMISNIVPMVSHVDHTEHSVDILITDQGIADLRGKDPVQRAHEIIDNCVHPEYKRVAPRLSETWRKQSRRPDTSQPCRFSCVPHRVHQLRRHAQRRFLKVLISISITHKNIMRAGAWHLLALYFCAFVVIDVKEL